MNQTKTHKVLMIGANQNFAHKLTQKIKDVFGLSISIEVSDASLNHVKAVSNVKLVMIVISKISHQLSNQALTRYKKQNCEIVKIEHQQIKFLDQLKESFMRLDWIPKDFKIIADSNHRNIEEKDWLNELKYQEIVDTLRHRLLTQSGKLNNIFSFKPCAKNVTFENILKSYFPTWKNNLLNEVKNESANIKNQINDEQLIFDVTQAFIQYPDSVKQLDSFVDNFYNQNKKHDHTFYLFTRMIAEVFFSRSKSFCTQLKPIGMDFNNAAFQDISSMFNHKLLKRMISFYKQHHLEVNQPTPNHPPVQFESMLNPKAIQQAQLTKPILSVESRILMESKQFQEFQPIPEPQSIPESQPIPEPQSIPEPQPIPELQSIPEPQYSCIDLDGMSIEISSTPMNITIPKQLKFNIPANIKLEFLSSHTEEIDLCLVVQPNEPDQNQALNQLKKHYQINHTTFKSNPTNTPTAPRTIRIQDKQQAVVMTAFEAIELEVNLSHGVFEFKIL